mgnify:CR=1 FL=1|jgi:hypothetical protein
MEALNTLERAKAPRAWRGRMPHSEGTMFCSRPITVDHVVINYITSKIMTPPWRWRVLGNTRYSTYTVAWPDMIGKDAKWKIMH